MFIHVRRSAQGGSKPGQFGHGFRVGVSCVLLFVLAGCANMNSVSRRYRFWSSDASAVSIDAKQRLMLTSMVETDVAGTKKAIRRFCSEPAPDVFSAYASALAGNFSLRNTSGAPSPELAAAFQSTMSEQVASLERTQTINVLREAMFRTCERYLSGAIGEPEFIVQAARDQRMIVSVLAIEQLTGVQKAIATALTTSAKASSGGAAAIVAVQAAEESKLKTREAAKSTRAVADASAPTTVDCVAAKASKDDAHKTKKAACEHADATEKSATAAEEHYTSLRRAFDSRILGNFSQEASGVANSGTVAQASANPVVANAVLDIVKEMSTFDEIGMTCIVMFRTGTAPIQSPLYNSCLALVAAKADLEASELNSRTSQLVQQITNAQAERTSALWPLLQVLDQNGRRIKIQAWASKGKSAVSSFDVEAMINASDETAFAKAFARLSQGQQQGLVDGSK